MYSWKITVRFFFPFGEKGAHLQWPKNTWVTIATGINVVSVNFNVLEMKKKNMVLMGGIVASFIESIDGKIAISSEIKLIM